MRIAYFTAGTVGAGHLVRGLAVGRGLRRAGFRAQYRIFGPELPFPAAGGVDFQRVAIESDPSLRDRNLAPTSALARELEAFAPELLIVDLFWAPLRWIVGRLSCDAWLLVRQCPPAWLLGMPGLPFEGVHYDRVIAIEPMPERGQRETIDPVVCCNREERRPKGALRERLGLGPESPLTVVVHAGQRRERELLADRAGEGAVVLDLFEPDAPFPAAEWLGDADRIVAGAGYNTYWEAAWLGDRQRADWLPFARQIDDQGARLVQGADHTPRRNGADILAGWILAG